MRLFLQLFISIPILFLGGICSAQEPAANQADDSAQIESDAEELQSPDKVDVEPLAEDSEIETRLNDILSATNWFENPSVEVNEGVAFLTGSTKTAEHRSWAGELAGNTQDVVAVVNRIKVIEKSMWDLSPAWNEISKLGRETVQMLPLFAVGVILLVLAIFAASWSVRLTKSLMKQRISNALLLNVISRAVAFPVFLIGLYLALRVSGLTQIAATVIGGTGLFGLIIGIAFRDIAENFLASVLISVQRPFAIGDLILVDGHEGYVQSVTARGTLLMTVDGNHIQIPNSSIYKSVIRNMTANPNRRTDFIVGIGYEDSITEAQSILLGVLKQQAAVLQQPAPMVLVDAMGASTIDLKVLFWVDGSQHSPLKVRSAVIRSGKRALVKAGISMPDGAREVIFPKGVPVEMLQRDGHSTSRNGQSRNHLSNTTASGSSRVLSAEASDEEPEMHPAEDGLATEELTATDQAEKSRQPEQGENLLAEPAAS